MFWGTPKPRPDRARSRSTPLIWGRIPRGWEDVFLVFSAISSCRVPPGRLRYHSGGPRPRPPTFCRRGEMSKPEPRAGQRHTVIAGLSLVIVGALLVLLGASLGSGVAQAGPLANSSLSVQGSTNRTISAKGLFDYATCVGKSYH